METRVFPIDPEDFDPAQLAEPARLIAEGALVAFPTETVYGIAANAHNPEAVHRLRKVKARPDKKPMSLHIAEASEVSRLVEDVPPVARKLMDLYWPGPLTIVFPGNAGAGIGVRLPAHSVARELIRQAGVPVVAPSANLSGDSPAVDCAGVLSVLNGLIDAVVDGGPVKIRQASTVVRLRGDDFDVLREGLLTESMIRKALYGKHVLLVCTGNSCRSPMAEGVLRKLLAERLGAAPDNLSQKGYRVSSAGVSAFPGGHASRHAVEVMAEQGIDIRGHRSRPLTREMAEEADFIVALGPSHRWHIEQWAPDLSSKVELISEEGILDPIGGSLETYRECALEIERALQTRWLERVLER